MVLELPSISDIADIMVFLVPGFVTFLIARRIALIDHKFSDLETIVLIIILSLVNYIPFGYLTGIDTLNQIGDKIFDPTNALTLLLIVIGMGFLIGWIFKMVFKKTSVAGSPWGIIYKKVRKGGAWVIVYTENREIKGTIEHMSEGDTREMILLHPKIIVRDSNQLESVSYSLGNSILLTEGEIKGIVIL